MNLKKFYVKTAFLYGELEEVYLEQPEGFDDGSGRVCRLKRSLCGLKQAPRCRNNWFISFMEKAGLKNSTDDPCLFYRTHEDSFLYIAIYVDDGLVVGNKDEEVEVFLGLLQEEFKITIDSLENFLGMQIVKVMGQFLLAKRRIQTRYCKSSTWLKQKVCRHVSREENYNHKDIVRQWAASCILQQQHALT